MSQIFRYPNVHKQIPGSGINTFKVEVESDGCKVKTIVNIPGDDDPLIDNSGQAEIGEKQNLIKEHTVVVSECYCPIQEEDEIFVKFFINDDLILTHQKDIEADRTHLVIFKIKFS